MAIYGMLRESDLGAQETARMQQAYEAALVMLDLLQGINPVTTLLAKQIIVSATADAAANPANIAAAAIKALGIPDPD